jgi:putative phosphoribosyl transferase
MERLIEVEIPAGEVALGGFLGVPVATEGIVLFAHGSGSGRHSPRNTRVAAQLRHGGLATLLIDLLTDTEEPSRAKVFDVDLLASRLVAAVRWADARPDIGGLPLGFFGASTGTAAAIRAAVALGQRVDAIVSRGGRPDLAQPDERLLSAPTLLLVGGADPVVLELNELSRIEMPGIAEVVVVPGAGHLFEEPGKLDAVAAYALAWFRRYLLGPADAA